MLKQDQEDAAAYAWNWFVYHANQRMTMIKFYMTVFGAIATGVGYLWTADQFVACMALSAFGVASVVSFRQLDSRTADLVKLGEAALRITEDQLAANLQDDRIQICRAADGMTAHRRGRMRTYLYTYTENIRLMLYLVGIGFISLTFFSILAASGAIIP